MNEYLTAASKEFDKINKKKHLINPLSTIDGEIIVQVIEILQKLKVTEAVSILEVYKFEKDTEILEKLTKFNSTINTEKESLGESIVKVLEQARDGINKLEMIMLNEVPYILKQIFYYEKIDIWDHDLTDYKYGIKLNETPDEAKKLPLYANKKIFYDCIEDRDDDYEKIDNLFTKK